eukprot:360822-Chlamydomonas_euryale.AAC.5
MHVGKRTAASKLHVNCPQEENIRKVATHRAADAWRLQKGSDKRRMGRLVQQQQASSMTLWNVLFSFT